MPRPENDHNIAKDIDIFRSAWSEGLYDLRTYEPGYCFTYDPPNKSKNGINNGLYILLGHEKLIQPFTTETIHNRDSSYITHSFEIYLHDKVNLSYQNTTQIHFDHFQVFSLLMVITPAKLKKYLGLYTLGGCGVQGKGKCSN